MILYVDFTMPMAPLRTELERVVHAAPEWDGRVCVLQVSDATERAMQVRRLLVSAATAGKQWDLRCRVREALIDFVAREYPLFLPQLRMPLAEQTLAADAGTLPPASNPLGRVFR